MALSGRSETQQVLAFGSFEVMEQATTMDSRRNEVLAVATLFFVLCWLTVSLRFYVRGKLMHTWGLDDT